MLHGLFLVSLVGSCYKGIKKTFTPTITAEQWENKDLIHQDMMKGVSVKQQIKNAENGKYLMTKQYPKPHRDAKTGKIVIENYRLWKKDLDKHGVQKTAKWVQQGKYNLTPEEFKKEQEYIKTELMYLYNV